MCAANKHRSITYMLLTLNSLHGRAPAQIHTVWSYALEDFGKQLSLLVEEIGTKFQQFSDTC